MCQVTGSSHAREGGGRSNNQIRMLGLFIITRCLLVHATHSTQVVQPESLPKWVQANFCQAPFPPDDVNGKSEDANGLKGWEIKQVHILARHADRAPEVWYPVENVEWNCEKLKWYQKIGDSALVQVETGIPLSNPFSDVIWRGSCSPGDLTPKGVKMAAKFGKILAKRYRVKPQDVLVRSVNSERCIGTAQVVLDNMFSHIKMEKPIKIHADAFVIDYLFPNELMCPRLGRLNAEMKMQPAWVAHLRESINLKSQLDTATGLNLSDKIILPGSFANDTLSDYVETIAARLCHGKQLPHGITMEQALQLLEIGNWEYRFKYGAGNDSLVAAKLRLASGLLIRELLDHIYHGSVHKLVYYSVRRNSFGPLLGILQGRPISWPPFISNLILEVWGRRRERAVRVIWNGEELKLSWCPFPCMVPDFVARLSNYSYAHSREVRSDCRI